MTDVRFHSDDAGQAGLRRLSGSHQLADSHQSGRNEHGARRHRGPVCPAGRCGPGDGNICHSHPVSFWSCTYYVVDGGCASVPFVGGEFEMLDPCGPGPGMYAPSLTFAGDDGTSFDRAETINPERGLLMLFSCWLYHQVCPYGGIGLRMSIAFHLGVSTREG